ncbi:MAG: hypothetical protein ACD_4C00021G0001, partial [uncultured bacterium (gcode 4)]
MTDSPFISSLISFGFNDSNLSGKIVDFSTTLFLIFKRYSFLSRPILSRILIWG